MKDGGAREPRRRVFFALWPDDATRRALVESTRSCVDAADGRSTPSENLHVTLAFVGESNAAELAAIRAIQPPRVGGFDLVIDTTGFRKRARILWAAPQRVPPALLALETGLWERLEEIGIERDRRAYLPHVTLARRASRANVDIEPVHWFVDEIVLVESILGPPRSTYTILETWPL